MEAPFIRRIREKELLGSGHLLGSLALLLLRAGDIESNPGPRQSGQDLHGAGDEGLPPGYSRETVAGKGGQPRRFIVCPLQEGETAPQKFEKYNDLRLHQRKTNQFMELKPVHFKAKPLVRKSMVQVVAAVSEVPRSEHSSKLENRRSHLDKFKGSINRGLEAGASVDHKEELKQVAVRLKNFRDKMVQNSAFMKIYHELMETRTKEDNPSNTWPEDGTSNTRAQIVLYAIDHMPETLALYVLTGTDFGRFPTNKEVITIGGQIASLQFLSSGNRKYANALAKSATVVSRACGLTYEGCDFLAKATGATFGHSAASRLRTELSVLSGVYYRHLASQFGLMMELDNLNIKDAFGSYNFTALALNFQEDRFTEINNKDEKSLEETLAIFNSEHMLLESDFNQDLREHYEDKVVNVAARVIGKKFEDAYGGMLRIFPKLYDHPNKKFAAKKDIQYLHKMLPFDENITDQMIKILTRIQDIYLDAVGRSARDPDSFKSALQKLKDKKAAPHDRRSADDYVWEEAECYGWIVVRCDLLTEERVRGAKTARRKAATRYGQLGYVRETTLGYLHGSLNKVVVDLKSTLGSEFGSDPASMAAFKTRLEWDLTSDRKVIENNYELYTQASILNKFSS